MVHKHDARRLHYDLRLEMNGVLASWAVPKGPSFDPSDRRLAVETEDHPLEYGGFEGRIPDGEYGAGDSLIWDRGTWETDPPGQADAMKAKGHIAFVLYGEKLRGKWHLVRTRVAGTKQQWLLFKAKDEFVSSDYDVVEERPESVVSGRRITRGPVTVSALRASHPPAIDLLLRVWPPMKATLASVDPSPESRWILEGKYDGFRALAAFSGSQRTLQSRNGLDLSQRFPLIDRALSKLVVAEAVLDGEIVAKDAQGFVRFEELQRSGPDQHYIAFDLLWLDGEDLRSRPLEERRELLESVLANAPPRLLLAERFEPPISDAKKRARKAGLEGLIAKRRGSRYSTGRSKDWLKLKFLRTQDLVVVGFLPLTTGSPDVGALLLAVREGKGFRYVGRVGTGFTDQDRRDFRRLLEADTVEQPPASDPPRARNARWVKPRHVVEVAFTEWTRDGKLRHPSLQRLRDDKSPEECVREEPPER